MNTRPTVNLRIDVKALTEAFERAAEALNAMPFDQLQSALRRAKFGRGGYLDRGPHAFPSPRPLTIDGHAYARRRKNRKARR